MKEIIAQATQKIKQRMKKEENLFGPDVNWERNYITLTNEIRLNSFCELLEELDDEFFNSDQRKEKYLSKDKCSRTLVTTFGTLTFTRRKYINKHTNSYFYFIDKVLELESYQRVSNTAKAFVLNEILSDKLSYAKSTKKLGLSKNFAYNLIRNLQTENITVSLPKVQKCINLHVVADEDHVAIQDKNRERNKNSTNRHLLRHVTIYTGIKQVSKGRGELIGRVVFTQNKGESIEEFSDRVHLFISKSYEISGDIFVYGDGAGWIKTLANIVGTKFIIDKFHVMQALMRVCGGKRNVEVREQLLSLIHANKKTAFKKAISELYPTGMSEFKERQVNYILNNWSYYQNNFKVPGVLSCCAEAINSHYFASRLSSRPKGFSIENMHKLGGLLALEASSINLNIFLQDNIKALTDRNQKSKKITTQKQRNTTTMPIFSSSNKQSKRMFRGLIYAYDDRFI